MKKQEFAEELRRRVSAVNDLIEETFDGRGAFDKFRGVTVDFIPFIGNDTKASKSLNERKSPCNSGRRYLICLVKETKVL